MSSKTIPVEHGGVTWKVIPGSRREQVLRRMIEQDRRLNHQVPPVRQRSLKSRILGEGYYWVAVLLLGFAIGVVVRVVQGVLQ